LSRRDGEIIDVQEASRILDVSDRQVRNLCKAGRLGKRLGNRQFFMTRGELEAFKNIERRPGRPSTRSKVMKVTWPVLDPNAKLKGKVLVQAEFENPPHVWSKGWYYRNPHAALLGPDGAAKLFKGLGEREEFRAKWGYCKFFACALKERPWILATPDGIWVYLLDQEIFDGRALPQIGLELLKAATKEITSRRELHRYMRYQAEVMGG
jgi:hypothetical protein